MITEIWNNLQDKYTFLCPWYWKDMRYALKCFFNPRTKWVTKSIGNRWLDLDTIYEKVLFAGIINYVEGEDALNFVNWDGTPEEKEYKRKIVEIYNWAKTGRQELQKQINAAYPSIKLDFHNPNGLIAYSQENEKKTYEELYGEVNRLEALLYDTNTKHLTWLIVNRNILWT